MSSELQHTEHPHQQPDAWHRHSAEEGMPQHEHAAHVSAPWLLAGLIGMIVTVVVIVVVTTLYYNKSLATLRADRETIALSAEHRTYRSEVQSQLSAYSWTNTEERLVAVPIDTAINTVIERYAAGENR